MERPRTQRQVVMDWVGIGWMALSILYLVAFPAALLLALS